MSLTLWGILLLVLKWILIALVYFVLVLVLYAVRREMFTKMGGRSPNRASVAAGRLRVMSNGSDKSLQTGLILNLRPESTLGADDDNDLVLRDQFVSRHHTRIRWDGAAWWIEDLGSRNGTFANGTRCPPYTPQRIMPGAIINIGDMSFELME